MTAGGYPGSPGAPIERCNGVAIDFRIKNGVAVLRRRRRDFAPAGELAGLPARISPKPFASSEPPKGMTHTAKNDAVCSVFFVINKSKNIV